MPLRVYALPVVWLAAAVGMLAAAPPTLEIPAENRPSGQYVTIAPKTDAVAVTYVGLDGLDPVPSQLLRDGRVFLLDSRGLKDGRYRFVAVGAGKTGEQARVDFVVVIGKGDVLPPVPDPKPGPQPDPGPPGGPAAYIVVVEETSARTPEHAKVLNDLAYWKTVRDREVKWRFYDKDAPEAVANKYVPRAVAAGLPAMLTLDKTGIILDARRLPGSTAAIDAHLREYGK